jgi:hypothetical protein
MLNNLSLILLFLQQELLGLLLWISTALLSI